MPIFNVTVACWLSGSCLLFFPDDYSSETPTLESGKCVTPSYPLLRGFLRVFQVVSPGPCRGSLDLWPSLPLSQFFNSLVLTSPRKAVTPSLPLDSSPCPSFSSRDSASARLASHPPPFRMRGGRSFRPSLSPVLASPDKKMFRRSSQMLTAAFPLPPVPQRQMKEKSIFPPAPDLTKLNLPPFFFSRLVCLRRVPLSRLPAGLHLPGQSSSVLLNSASLPGTVSSLPFASSNFSRISLHQIPVLISFAGVMFLLPGYELIDPDPLCTLLPFHWLARHF